MYTYLIIDDESLIRKAIIKKLLPLQEQVQCCGEAANGKKGMELVAEKEPDFLILDMYMPVMDGLELLPWLSRHYPELPLIVISGYQNFDYMKQAITSKVIDYILKPFSAEAIQKAVCNVVNLLQNQQQQEKRLTAIEAEKENACYHLDIKLLENLILGYETETRKTTSQKLSFVNHNRPFVLITLYQKKSLWNGNLQKWLEENGCGNMALTLSHPSILQFKFIILFVPEDISFQKRYIDRFVNILFLWADRQKLHIRMGISTCHTHLSRLHTAFSETTEALNALKISDTAASWFFSENCPPPAPISWEHTEEFLFRIESGMPIETQELLEQLFDYYSTLEGCTLADVKHHCQQLSSRCRVILNYYLNQQEDYAGYSSSMQTIVNTLFCLEDLKNYYRQFFLNVANMMQNKSVYANHEQIDRIMIYMQRNYQKNLTQEFIASLFYLNRSYLSQLFRQKTGMKFVDYLNNIRIDKAKELLANTDRKMYQIAKAVGYDNTKYFFRIFKKKTGLTPEQYRENRTNRK